MKSAFSRFLPFLKYSPARLGVFLLFVALAGQLPGWLSGLGWLAVLAIGVWTFLALRRDSFTAWDFLAPRVGKFWRRTATWTARRNAWWKRLTLVLAILLVGLAVVRAWPSWRFMASSSLREDEILNISRYTSKGFAPAVSTYHLARNHIFFNVINGVLPGGGSYTPWRARLVSFVSVLAALTLLVVYAARRGWAVAGAACAGLVGVNYFAQKILLEARGYGLISLFASVGCIAFAEWLRVKNPRWLTALAVSCVLGTYTLPYYVIFGGALLLLAFAMRPGRDTFLAGFLSVVALALLYAPVAGKVLSVFTSYGDDYKGAITDDFHDFPSLFRLIQHFVPYEVLRVDALAMAVAALLILGHVSFARYARRSDRQAVAGVALAFLLFVVFCLALGTVPMRVAAFTALPMAFLGIVMCGSALSAKTLVPIRPLVLMLFSAAAGVLIWRSQTAEPLIPRQNWRGLAETIHRLTAENVPVVSDKKYGRLVEVYLPNERKVSEGGWNPQSLVEGRSVFVEPYFKDGDHGKRVQRENLPPEIRFVTAPLFINYHRIFFRPPENRGIAKLTADGQTLPLSAPGDQIPDPALLTRSYHQGDVLSAAAPLSQAVVTPVTLPIVFQAVLESPQKSGCVNFLFSQALADKKLRAEIQDQDGRWSRTDRISTLGEWAAIEWRDRDVTAVRLAVEDAPQQESDVPRPPFGILEVWLTSYR